MDEKDRVIQVNLHHFKATSTTLLFRFESKRKDITVIKKPRSLANEVCELGHKNYRLVHLKFVFFLFSVMQT